LIAATVAAKFSSRSESGAIARERGRAAIARLNQCSEVLQVERETSGRAPTHSQQKPSARRQDAEQFEFAFTRRAAPAPRAVETQLEFPAKLTDLRANTLDKRQNCRHNHMLDA
jgi:hypothetical protein